ncbi:MULTISPECIES: DUF502 domain-containing protein [Saliphagus]|uniref:DUF502 domain-containing protein n=1 Tax=Saliphagus infecundisoli TaxID=1849069 RepID=A0ABD5QHR3_9EURY|nr:MULTISPECIES: DUF502 domain-containing protein [Saliphagus]
MSSWKRDFASGLVVLGPILVSLYLLFWLYGFVAGFTPAVILDAEALQWLVPGSGDQAAQTRRQLAQFVRVTTVLVVFAALTLSIGYLMRTTVGGLAERMVDDVANRVPGLRVVYNASKMAAETAFGEQDSLQEPVKLEVWEGLRMTAFRTGKTTDDDREVLFLPTSPNITTGYVIEVEPDRLMEIDEDVEDALTRILSAGFGDADRHGGMDAGVPIDVVDDRESAAAVADGAVREGTIDAGESTDPGDDGGGGSTRT